MTQALRKLLTFDDFVAQYSENPHKHYELYDGIIVEMPPPTGDYEKIVGFLVGEIVAEYKRLKLPYFIPKS